MIVAMRFQSALRTAGVAMLACACSGTMSLGDKVLSNQGGTSGMGVGGTNATGMGGTLAAGGTSWTGGTSFFGSGGTESSGGTMGSPGGTLATTGGVSAGGAEATGGGETAGGTTSVGGTNAAGETSTAGSNATGGATNAGGSMGTGGTEAPGGTTSTGGTGSTGGAGGAAPNTSSKSWAFCPGSPACLASAVSPSDIAVNESDVYFQLQSGSVMSVPVVGGAVSTVYFSPFPLDANIVLDAERVYWGESEATINDPDSGVSRYVAPYVQSALLSGGGRKSFTPYPSTLTDVRTNTIRTIVVDSTNLYIAGYYDLSQGSPCAFWIRTVPLNGNPATDFSGVCVVAHIAIDSSNIYWTDPVGGVYVNSIPSSPGIKMAPLAGGATIHLATALEPHAIAVYAGHLYWTDTSAGQVMDLTLAGSSTPVLLATSSAPGDMVVDASGVYWIDNGNAILRVPLQGGAVQTLVTDQTAVGLATNSTSVFWINSGSAENNYQDGGVLKLER